MIRWFALIVIGAVVVTGIQGCVLVVADEGVAQEVREDRSRSRLARDIERAIERDAELSRSDIRVSEADGVVTLKGDVESPAALSRAVAIALGYEGVHDLRLRLAIEPGY